MTGPQKVSSTGTQIPVYYGQYPETFIGGFTLDTSNLATAIAAGLQLLQAGSVVNVDEYTRRMKLIKTASLQAAALSSDTIYKFNKGHLFVVGEFVGFTVGGLAVTISAIDTSNAAYDSVTLSATLAVAIPAFGALYQALAAGSTGALISTPSGLTLRDEQIATAKDFTVVRGGAVYSRRTTGHPVGIQSFMPKITFSNSQ